MVSFFKKRKGKDAVVDSTNILPEETEKVTDPNRDVHTELSYHPLWNVSQEQKYYYAYLNNELAPLKENQLSISGIDLEQNKDGYEVTAFIRNSLNKTISLETLQLALLDENGKTLARKEFDFQAVGEIPAESSRPWKFQFGPKDLLVAELPSEGWTLTFVLQPKKEAGHTLDLADTWEKSLPNEEKEKLANLVKSLTPPKKGEINLMGLQANLADNGDLHVTILIRNGSDKTINLEQIPLHVEDATGEIIAKGGFKLDNFDVKANSSKPWTFIFPASLVSKNNPDFSTWKAYAPQGK